MIRAARRFLMAAGSALVLTMSASLPGAAKAEPMNLKFSIPLPPFSSLNKQVLAPWAGRIAKDSNGALDVQVYAEPGITTLGNSYDRTINGVVDMAWGIMAPITTQFPKTNVVTLPFEARNGLEATMGMWTLYKDGLIADEWSKVHVLAFATFPGIYIHSNKPIKTMADLRGLRISADSRVPSLALERLGATPVHMPVSELYEASHRGTIDAIAIAWPAIMSFKLYETTRYHLEVPLGNDGAFVAMNKQSYDRLPAAGKEAVDKESGLVLTKIILEDVTGHVSESRAFTGKQPGHVISQLAPAEEARWIKTASPVIDQWVKETPDGAKVLAAYRAEIAKIRATEK